MPAVPGDQGWDDTALNPSSIQIGTNRARANATVAKSGIAETVKSCVQAGESALWAGHVIECVQYPCFTAA